MRIAMVSEHASPLAGLGGVDAGGQNVHVAALSTALAERGHDVTVYTRRDDKNQPDRVVLDSRVQVEHVLAGPARPVAKDKLPPYMPAFATQLTRRWRLARPDVVHAHFWMSGQASLKAAQGDDEHPRLPVVQTFHALGTVKRRWQGAADTSPPHRIATELAIALGVDRIIATCADEVSELERLGAEASRIDVVPCGVDADRFQPQPGRERPDRILSIGRLVPRKGVDDVIRALTELPGTQLLIAGGPTLSELDADPEGARLRRLAHELGVADQVVFVGRIAHEELPALISSAALVVAAPWYEPFGIVPLEAMACAVPVVASAVGGMLDTVTDGQTGLLVPPRQPAALAAAIRALLQQPDHRRELGRNARRQVLQRYTWSAVAAATEQSLTTAIGGRSSRTRMEATR